jgi:hypothetical protein
VKKRSEAVAEKQKVWLGGLGEDRNGRFPRGKAMTKGTGWRLARTGKGGIRKVFKGTLLDVYNIGTKRIAIFSVPKNVA